jgi:hypothetical protein
MASVETLSQLSAYRADLLSKARQQQSAPAEVNEKAEASSVKADLEPDLDPLSAPQDEIKGQLLDLYA